MRHVAAHHFLIIVVASVVFLTNLGVPQLFDEDEPKNAACASEMMHRGDWIVPWFNGELRTDKPILLYWFMLVAYHSFGVSEFTARICSALFGIGTVVLTYHIGRRIFDRSTGLWGALLLCCSLMFTVASRAATPDSVLIFFSTLALWLFVRGSFPISQCEPGQLRGIPQHKSTFVAIYAAMGVAVLAKGPIGVLLPSAVIGCYLLCVNRVDQIEVTHGSHLQRKLISTVSWLIQTFWPARVWSCAKQLRLLTCVAVVAIVILPWYLAVAVQTRGEWIAGFLWKHNFGRYMAPMEGHGGPPFYHVMSLFVGFFPASIFLVPSLINAVRRIRTEESTRSGLVFLLGWVAVYVSFFSLAGTKLPSYVTPTHPALALLTASFLLSWARAPEQVSRFWQHAPLAIFGFVGLVVFAGGGLAAWFLFPSEIVLAGLGVLPLTAAAVCLYLVARRQINRAAIVYLTAAVLFLSGIFGWGAARISRYQNGATLAEAIQRYGKERPQVVAYRAFRPSWVFYADQPIPLILHQEKLAEFLDEHDDAIVITSEERWREVRSDLDPDMIVLANRQRFFLKKQRYVLLAKDRMSESSTGSVVDMRSASRPSGNRR